MTTKEKAAYLVELFATANITPMYQCQVSALILVDEILKEYKEQLVAMDSTIDVAYWNNVKLEIENM